MNNNNHEDPNQCNCARCRAIASGMTPEEADQQQRDWENNCLIERGFYTHMVGDPESPTHFNAHTHGLDQFDDHLDFQVVVPMPQQVVHSILCILSDRVKEGERFSAGDIVNEVIQDHPIKLVEATEDERKVLRVILPDPSGNLEPDEINEQYSAHYLGVAGVTLKPRPKKPWIPYAGPKHGKSK